MTAFAQGLPADGIWKLRDPYDKSAGSLVYVETTTGAEIEVPSVWYNQPVEARVSAFRFYAEQRRLGARELRASTIRDAIFYAERNESRALELDAIADEMERTGKVIA